MEGKKKERDSSFFCDAFRQTVWMLIKKAFGLALRRRAEVNADEYGLAVAARPDPSHYNCQFALFGVQY